MTEQTFNGLKKMGCSVIHVQVNASGRFVHLIQSEREKWDVAMFSEDAGDLVTKRATIDQIINRNRGADLADPWPRLADLSPQR